VGQYLWVCGSECVLCVGQFGAGLEESVCAVFGKVWGGFVGVCLCCVWDSFGRVCGREFLLCGGHFGAGMADGVCAVCGTVWGVIG